MSKQVYTTEQIRTGAYDFREVFGPVVQNPLPFRLVGFEEAEVNGEYIDGLYHADVYCCESMADAESACRSGWIQYLMGIYQLQPDGRTWNLIPDSWKRLRGLSHDPLER